MRITGFWTWISQAPISLYVIGMAAITTLSVYVASESAHRDISADSASLDSEVRVT